MSDSESAVPTSRSDVRTTPSKAGVTARELQRIALRLANQAWVRYWLHWNYPVESPWLMAIQAKDAFGRDVEVKALAAWDRVPVGGIIPSYAYVIERRDEDGTPFRSPLTGTVLSDPDPHGPATGPDDWEANR